jgi:hypothetical protein
MVYHGYIVSRRPIDCLWWAFSVGEALPQSKLHCGVGTNTFADCPQCLVARLVVTYATGMGWNEKNPSKNGILEYPQTPWCWTIYQHFLQYITPKCR